MSRQVFLYFSIAVLAAACATGEARSVRDVPDIRVPQWPLSTHSEEARRHIERGEVYEAAQYTDAAHDEFERAAAADSSLGYAYAAMSLVSSSSAEQGRDLDAARARMANAGPVERAAIAHILASAESDVAGMLDAAHQLTTLAPRNPRAWLELAAADSAAGHIADARADLAKAIEVDSTFALSYITLATTFVFVDLQDTAQAERAVETGVRLWPSEPVSYRALGSLRRAEGRLDEAIAAYSRAIALDPSGDWYILRANAELFAGQYERARADYALAITHYSPGGLYYPAVYRALIPAYRGEPDSCLAELREYESAIDGLRVPSPGHDKWYVLSAELKVAVRHARMDVARRADSLSGPLYRIDLAPYGAPGLRFAEANSAFNHGLIAVYSGDYAAAKRFADEIVRIRAADNDPSKDQPAHFLRGEVARLQHDYPRALQELSLADPNGMDIETIYARALTADGMGRLDEARTLYQKVANYRFQGPENASVHYDAVKRLAALGK